MGDFYSSLIRSLFINCKNAEYQKISSLVKDIGNFAAYKFFIPPNMLLFLVALFNGLSTILFCFKITVLQVRQYMADGNILCIDSFFKMMQCDKQVLY
jgi:hypothetical protein